MGLRLTRVFAAPIKSLFRTCVLGSRNFVSEKKKSPNLFHRQLSQLSSSFFMQERQYLVYAFQQLIMGVFGAQWNNKKLE
jgi:hypothetical protein